MRDEAEIKKVQEALKIAKEWVDKYKCAMGKLVSESGVVVVEGREFVDSCVDEIIQPEKKTHPKDGIFDLIKKQIKEREDQIIKMQKSAVDVKEIKEKVFSQLKADLNSERISSAMDVQRCEQYLKPSVVPKKMVKTGVQGLVRRMKKTYLDSEGSQSTADLIFGKDGALKNNLSEIKLELEAKAKSNDSYGFLSKHSVASRATLDAYKNEFVEVQGQQQKPSL